MRCKVELQCGYTYEPKRDLKTRVRNSFSGSIISQYDYRYDLVGRRSTVEKSGMAFGATSFTSWGYDERNQVTASNGYTGTFTLPDPGTEAAGERRAYEYDPIGNRKAAIDRNGMISISYAANELNEYDLV